MITGSVYTHEFQEKEIEFVVTRKARIIIEKKELSIFDGIQDASIFTVIMEQQSLQKRLADAKEAKNEEAIEKIEAEMSAITAKILPNMKTFMELQGNGDDEYEIAKTLLMNSNAANGEIDEKLADAILEDMELKLGFEEFENVMLKIFDTVFTQIATIKDRKEEIHKRTARTNEKALPLS